MTKPGESRGKFGGGWGIEPEDDENSVSRFNSPSDSAEEVGESVKIVQYLEDHDDFISIPFRKEVEFKRGTGDDEYDVSLPEYLKEKVVPAVIVRKGKYLEDDDLAALEENYRNAREIRDEEGGLQGIAYGCPEHDPNSMESGEYLADEITFEEARPRLG